MHNSEIAELIRAQGGLPIEILRQKPACGLRCVGTGEDFDRCNHCQSCASYNGFITESDTEGLTAEQKALRDSMWDNKLGFFREDGCILSRKNEKGKHPNRILMSETCLRHTCIHGVI